MLMVDWVGMDRSIRSRFPFYSLFFHWRFNMNCNICIGTAKGLERFNSSIEGGMGGVKPGI
jgi:hypothetical protein